MPDVVHFHEIINFPLLNICGKSKIILHLYSFCLTNYGFFLSIILYFINKFADIVILPTQSILIALESKLTCKSIIIQTPYLDLHTNDILSGMNMDIQQMKNDGYIIFAFVGRICSIKRIDHFIKALKFLSNDVRDKVRFCIIGGTNTIGDEEYLLSLKQFIERNFLENNICFLGYINTIEQILPYVDYGVILSESEAVPMIGIEYMKFNIPIIGYQAPGISDFLYNGVNGFLLKNGSIEAITDCVNCVISKISNYNFTESISLEFRKYTIENFTESIRKIY